MLLGVMLFFDGALLALGNVCISSSPESQCLTDSAQILFISGLTLIIGPQKTFYFFARKQKLRGTICFLGGILLVFFKWPFIGVIVETFGFLNLFGYVSLPHIIYTLCAGLSLIFCVVDFLPQRFFPCHHHLSSTTTVRRHCFVTTIHKRRKSISDPIHSIFPYLFHRRFRWWTESLDREHRQYDYLDKSVAQIH